MQALQCHGSQVRELNRNGIHPTLSELDQALQPIFVAEDAGDPRHQSVEMSAQVGRHFILSVLLLTIMLKIESSMRSLTMICRLVSILPTENVQLKQILRGTLLMGNFHRLFLR